MTNGTLPFCLIWRSASPSPLSTMRRYTLRKQHKTTKRRLWGGLAAKSRRISSVSSWGIVFVDPGVDIHSLYGLLSWNERLTVLLDSSFYTSYIIPYH